MAAPCFETSRIALRLLQLALGFVATAVAANHWAGENGHLMMELEVNPTRVDLVRAWFDRPAVEDVLIIGSSRVAGGFDAVLMNEQLAARSGNEFHVYKLGVAGMRPALLADILEQGVARRPPRHLLVLAIEERYFAYPVVVPSRRRGKGVANTKPLQGEWETDRVPEPLWDWARGLEVVWREKQSVATESLDARRRYQENFGERVDLAERLKSESQAAEILPTRADNLDLPDYLVWEWPAPDSTTMDAWWRILDVVADLPCETIFVRMPLQKSFIAEHMAKEDALFESQIVASVRAAGHDYLDLSTNETLTEPQYFFSMTHLNRSGCIATSRHFVAAVLVPFLRERAAATATRGD